MRRQTITARPFAMSGITQGSQAGRSSLEVTQCLRWGEGGPRCLGTC